MANEQNEGSELEEVARTGQTGPLPVLVCMVALTVALGFTLLVYLAFLDNQPAGADLLVPLLVCSACLALSVWALRLPLFDYHWKTSPDGLLVKGILRRRFIRWSEVESMETRWVWFGPCHVLRTKRGSVATPTRYVSLGASIGLHLSRQDRPGLFTRTESSTRTWHPMLDAQPEEVAWENQRRHELRSARGAFALILLVPATIAVWMLLTGRTVGAAVMASVVFLVFGARQHSPMAVWRVACDASGLLVHAVVGVQLMAIALPWQLVSQAEWVGNGIHVLSDQGSGVLIPWHPEDRSSTRLILSVLSHLRATSQVGLVPIPNAVLKAVESAQ